MNGSLHHNPESPMAQPEPLGALQALETQRFVTTPESMKIMKGVVGNLPYAREANPAVQGVGFMGSRTKGLERPDSDLDLLVFYDRSIDYIGTDDLDRLTIGTGVRPDSTNDGELMFSFGVNIAQKVLKEEVVELDKAVSIIAREDLASSTTAELFPILHQRDIRSFRNVVSLFHLAAGKPVYRARRYVFDQLEQYETADQIMSLVGDLLNYDERELAREKHPATPLYQDFPQTLPAARNYFINSDYNVGPVNTVQIADRPSEAWFEARYPNRLAANARQARAGNFIARMLRRLS